MHLRELVVSYRRRRVPVDCEPRRLETPSAAASVLCPMLEEEPVEVFGVLLLNSKRRLLGYHQLARGNIDSTPVGVRELFQAVFLANAASVILAHNHPSGDPTPSPDDIAITQRLIEAGRLMGVAVLDHIIVGHDGRYYSFKEAGGIS
jgi:DNA repair protein RadC